MIYSMILISEAVARRYSAKKLFWRILQNSLKIENTKTFGYLLQGRRAFSMNSYGILRYLHSFIFYTATNFSSQFLQQTFFQQASVSFRYLNTNQSMRTIFNLDVKRAMIHLCSNCFRSFTPLKIREKIFKCLDIFNTVIEKLLQSLFESSMSVSDGQRIFCTAIEKFCNRLMLLSLCFGITLVTLFIWTIKIVKYRLLILSLSVTFVSDGQNRHWWKNSISEKNNALNLPLKSYLLIYCLPFRTLTPTAKNSVVTMQR